MNVDLSPLKDIHLAPEPATWPLAFGWWLLALVALFVVMAICVFFALYWTSVRRATWREFKQLSHLSDKAYLPAVNRLLKRVAIYKDSKTAALYGQKWFAFLNKTKDVHFTQEDIALFEKRLYNGSAKMSGTQRKRIHRCAALWLKHNL